MHTQIKQQPPTSNQQPLIQQFMHTGEQGTITGTTTTNHIPVAFVEFRDVNCAGQAMQLLQGKYLLSSDRGAMRIEYAKSKMAANELYRMQPSMQHHNYSPMPFGASYASTASNFFVSN